MTAGSDPPAEAPTVPRPAQALLTLGVAALVIDATGWLALSESAERAQTGVVRWFNDPPQPIAAVFAVVNLLFRPITLTLLSVASIGLVLLTPHQRRVRLEILRALVVSLALTELMPQVMKDLANQARPLAVIGGLETHGYPVEPLGNAYPSADTALFFGAACALWPWTRWPRRIVGVTIAVLVA
jgi:hypothetical protein